MVVFTEPISSLLFSFSANFSNHDNAFGFWVVNEAGKAVNKVGSIEWISTNSYDSRLSESEV